jgi:hypothetical protein
MITILICTRTIRAGTCPKTLLLHRPSSSMTHFHKDSSQGSKNYRLLHRFTSTIGNLQPAKARGMPCRQPYLTTVLLVQPIGTDPHNRAPYRAILYIRMVKGEKLFSCIYDTAPRGVKECPVALRLPGGVLMYVNATLI